MLMVTLTPQGGIIKTKAPLPDILAAPLPGDRGERAVTWQSSSRDMGAPGNEPVTPKWCQQGC